MTEHDRFRFNVACNWDRALISGLRPYADDINYLYGKTKTDVFSGGRAASELRDIERKEAADYITEARENGLAFNYLLNGTFLPNEFGDETRLRVREDLEWIASTDAESVTVSIPLLARIIRDSYPSLRINVSTFAHVRTPRQARQWRELGASSICLDRHLVRNFEQIEVLTREVTDIEMNLLVNDPCLMNCVEEAYHDHLMSKGSVLAENYLHYCSFHCLAEFLNTPRRIIGSTFIRPQDLWLYGELGITLFKIVDRNRSTKFILNAVEAYVNQVYRGNLVDLFSLFSSYDRPPADPTQLAGAPLTAETLDRFWRDLPAMAGLIIDNAKMDGYAEQVRVKSERTGLCETIACDSCGLCESRAKRALRYDERRIAALRERLVQILGRLDALNYTQPR